MVAWRWIADGASHPDQARLSSPARHGRRGGRAVAALIAAALTLPFASPAEAAKKPRGALIGSLADTTSPQLYGAVFARDAGKRVRGRLVLGRTSDPIGTFRAAFARGDCASEPGRRVLIARGALSAPGVNMAFKLHRKRTGLLLPAVQSLRLYSGREEVGCIETAFLRKGSGRRAGSTATELRPAGARTLSGLATTFEKEEWLYFTSVLAPAGTPRKLGRGGTKARASFTYQKIIWTFFGNSHKPLASFFRPEIGDEVIVAFYQERIANEGFATRRMRRAEVRGDGDQLAARGKVRRYRAPR